MTRIVSRGLGILLLVLTSVTAQADDIDDYVKAEMRKRQIPGLALAIVKDGKIIKAKGYGLANVELDVPVSRDSVFELASVTKQFTATAIMLLVEEGKVGLDDKISKYLPNAPDAWSGITVRHLLTHTAGLKDYFGGDTWLANYTTGQLFESASKLPLDFAPGERWQYSDQGYFLLGMIIEKVSEKRYHEFLTERLFAPLGMTATTVIDQWKIIKNRARGYTLRDGKLAHIRRDSQLELPSWIGVLSTVKDLAKWDAALYTGKILKKSSLDQMWSPARLSNGMAAPTVCGFYGFGWCLDELRGHRVVQHGGITGTRFFRLPDDNLTVIVLTNLGVGGSWLIAQAVAGFYDPRLSPFHMLKDQPDPDPERTRMLMSLLSDILNGKQDSALITAGLLARIASLSPEARSTLASKLKDQKYPKLLLCDDVQDRQIERFGLRVSTICYYKFADSLKTAHFRFYMTADGKVADFRSYVE